jgi:predicted metal-dependent phosphoesterase TrpH
MKIDLHAHTHHSDGELSPRDLVRSAARAGVNVLGVVDHDTVDGLPEALAEGAAAGVRVVPGIELSTHGGDEDIHMLGYFVDPATPGLPEFLGELREARRERVHRIIAALQRGGLRITAEEVFAEAQGGSISRSHVARVLLKRNLVRSRNQAFQRYLGRRGSAYVPASPLTPREGIARIHATGGVAVIAHPGWLKDDGVIPSLVADGMDGIEAYYPDARPADVERYLGIARRYRLLVSGGSDHHGEELHGSRLGALCCPEEDFRKLEERHRQHAAARPV